MYPLQTPDPLGQEILLAVAGHFWMTWVTEGLCIVAVLVSRPGPAINAKLRRCLDEGLTNTSRLWVIPLYMWGLESTLNVLRGVFDALSSMGIPPLTYYFTWFYEVALALFFLVLFQSLAVLLVDRPSVTLGLSGGRNLAGVAVILSVFWINMTLMWFLVPLPQKQYGIPIRLKEVRLSGPIDGIHPHATVGRAGRQKLGN